MQYSQLMAAAQHHTPQHPDQSSHPGREEERPLADCLGCTLIRVGTLTCDCGGKCCEGGGCEEEGGPE